MNIHPIFVHFPIAFLTAYAVFEMIRLKRLNDSPTWFYLKSLLLILGVIGAFAALQTGEMAEQFHRDVRQLTRLHEMFAKIATLIFGLLAANYASLLIARYSRKILPPSLLKFWNLIMAARRPVFTGPVIVILALAGLITLTIAGALGGAIVYGKDADPITSFISRALNYVVRSE